MGDKQQVTTGGGAMMRIAAFIVDKRMLFFLIYIIAVIFSFFSSRWVDVENDITMYLDKSTETRRGIDLMDKEFVTYGTADVMIANITFDDAKALQREIENMEGVSTVAFTSRGDEQEDFVEHYNNGSALFSITFDYTEDDDRALAKLDEIKARLADYDIYVSTELGDQDAEILDAEMQKIKVIVAFVVVGVLLFTCQSFGEIPVLLITFVTAMLLDGGTNFLFGRISFISNSVSSILQLALSVDYAIILCNHYKEDRQTYDVRDAAVVALSKSIPEISSSSLTTISGLFALVFMHFGIGKDLGTILIKSILLSLISVFTLMPGLLVMFSGLMEKTEHRNFVPKIDAVGEYAYKTFKVVPICFFVLFLVAGVVSQHCPYVYGDTLLKTPVLNENQIAKNMIKANFKDDNMVAVLMPGHDYEAETSYIKALESGDEVDHCLGLANTEVEDDYTLTDSLTPREFSEVIDIDYEICVLIYEAYAAEQEEYGRMVTGVKNYRIPLMDMLAFAADKVHEGYVEIDESTADDLFDADEQIQDARDQLEGKHYDRILVYLNLPEESDETYDYLDKMHETGVTFFGKDNPVIIVGNSTSNMELKEEFSTDNVIVSVISILFVLVVLLFTFKSVGLPLLQILVIEGAIFINFAIPAVFGWNIYFMSYLIVSSIQMGANIDYAIVISNRYIEVRKEKERKQSIIEALDFAFSTIISSGTMMVLAGFSIGMMSSDTAIVGLGQALGRGTLISIALVLFVLPQILLFGDKFIALTTFEMYRPVQMREERGDILVNGTIRGQVNGTVAARVSGIIRGDANVALVSGSMDTVSAEIAEQIESIFRENAEDKDIQPEIADGTSGSREDLPEKGSEEMKTEDGKKGGDEA